ncbi:MAG: DoxX family protein [Chloroflexia bacterium]|nr:DoxX family protein [Chloroflexia bacterium]
MNHLPAQEAFEARIDPIDRTLTRWLAHYSIPILRIGLGIVFLWFGVLKFFPGLSPAEDLVRNTIFFIDPDLFMPVLALWEMVIGLGLIFGRFMRLTLLLLFLQMPGTLLPLFILPDVTWQHIPYSPTVEGQYIIKNLVLIGAGLVLGATVRGGGIEPEQLGPQSAKPEAPSR